MTDGRLVSVNIVHEIRDDPDGDVGRTAIDKRPASSPVQLDADGPVGDTVMDREHHGGLDQAVYAYASEDLAGWSKELGRELVPGQFGENLTTEGIDVSGAVIGSVWNISGCRLQVRAHRTPCTTFAAWMGEPHWVKRFTDRGAPGAYLKVLTAGPVQRGDAIVVEFVPEHRVTVSEVFRGRRGDISRLVALSAEPGLADDMVAYLRREISLGRGSAD
jgi:MOSC domain-containing protein YiiM